MLLRMIANLLKRPRGNADRAAPIVSLRDELRA
jgi:hypothetical protein